MDAAVLNERLGECVFTKSDWGEFAWYARSKECQSMCSREARAKQSDGTNINESAGVEKRAKEWTSLGETTTLDVSSIRPKGPVITDSHPSCTLHCFPFQ